MYPVSKISDFNSVTEKEYMGNLDKISKIVSEKEQLSLSWEGGSLLRKMGKWTRKLRCLKKTESASDLVGPTLHLIEATLKMAFNRLNNESVSSLEEIRKLMQIGSKLCEVSENEKMKTKIAKTSLLVRDKAAERLVQYQEKEKAKQWQQLTTSSASQSLNVLAALGGEYTPVSDFSKRNRQIYRMIRSPRSVVESLAESKIAALRDRIDPLDRETAPVRKKRAAILLSIEPINKERFKSKYSSIQGMFALVKSSGNKMHRVELRRRWRRTGRSRLETVWVEIFHKTVMVRKNQ